MYIYIYIVIYIYTYIYIYISVNPCIKCMECSVTQFEVSEFCETLTGGFTREFPALSKANSNCWAVSGTHSK